MLLRLDYGTMRRKLELCAFKLEDMDYAPKDKPIIQLNFSKTDQYTSGKVPPISEALIGLLGRSKGMVDDGTCMLRSINKNVDIG